MKKKKTKPTEQFLSLERPLKEHVKMGKVIKMKLVKFKQCSVTKYFLWNLLWVVTFENEKQKNNKNKRERK